jgi:hypothetical protein
VNTLTYLCRRNDNFSCTLFYIYVLPENAMLDDVEVEN